MSKDKVDEFLGRLVALEVRVAQQSRRSLERDVDVAALARRVEILEDSDKLSNKAFVEVDDRLTELEESHNGQNEEVDSLRRRVYQLECSMNVVQQPAEATKPIEASDIMGGTAKATEPESGYIRHHFGTETSLDTNLKAINSRSKSFARALAKSGPYIGSGDLKPEDYRLSRISPDVREILGDCGVDADDPILVGRLAERIWYEGWDKYADGYNNGRSDMDGDE